MRVRFNWWIVFAVFTVHGLLEFTYNYLDWAARAHHVDFRIPFIEEMTGHYTALLLFPAVIWLVRRFPLSRSRWAPVLTLYAAALLAFSAAHTTLNALSRDALFPLAGLGAYDYGIMRIRYFMEFPVDVFAFVSMAIAIYALDFYHASKQREVAAARLETDLAQAQLQNLRLQLQPHFLFNALNTISSVMYEDVRAADEMLARLSEFLRLTLRSAPAQEVRLSEELEFLDLYLNIMRARFESNLRVNMEIENGLENALVPQLVLQPLVENSIRHGAAPDSGLVSIDVSARRTPGALQIRIRDHGIGMRESRQTLLGRGIGLANTAGRLDRLYGPDHHLDLANAEDGGLVVSVSIPFHT